MSLTQIKTIINTAFEKENYLYTYAFNALLKHKTKSFYKLKPYYAALTINKNY